MEVMVDGIVSDISEDATTPLLTSCCWNIVVPITVRPLTKVTWEMDEKEKNAPSPISIRMLINNILGLIIYENIS